MKSRWKTRRVDLCSASKFLTTSRNLRQKPNECCVTIRKNSRNFFAKKRIVKMRSVKLNCKSMRMPL